MRSARVISFLFHPLFMPLAGVFILLTFGGWLSTIPPEGKRFIYLVTGISTLVVPLLAVPLLVRFRVVTDLRMPDISERRVPLLIMAMLYLACAYILQRAQAPFILSLFLNASSLVVLIVAVINWRWKISTHMAAIGAVTGMALSVSLRMMLGYQLLLALLFVISGLTGYARLREDDHTPAQVYAGYLVGFAVNFIVIRLI